MNAPPNEETSSSKFSARMPSYFFVVAASLLLALAFIGNNLLLNVNENNADIRVDRAGRAAAALVDANLEDVVINTGDDNAPTSIQIDLERLEPSEAYNDLLDTIGGVNEGAANIFRLNTATNSYDRIATTFRNPDTGERVGGTMVEPGLISAGHPAFDNVRSGERFVGEVPIPAGLRLAYLTPLVDSDNNPIGILAVDVGFVDDLGRINADATRNTILFTLAALALVLVGLVFFIRRFVSPLYKLIGLANDLGTADGGSAAAELDETTRELSERQDEIGALSRGLGKVSGLRTELEHQAYFDSLTKLPVRSSLLTSLGQKLRTSASNPLGVSIVGIDGFKQVNDRLGQQAADELLISYADRLSAVLNDGEILARVGGDEFAVLSSVDPHNEQWAKELHQRLALASQDPFSTTSGEARVSTTAGITLAPRDGSDPEKLMANADLALNEGKRRVRGSFQMYEPRLSEGFERQTQLLPELRKAIDTEALEIAYQPVFDRSGRVIAVEGLTRWNHAELGVISPAEFIPLAESSGMISSIGEWSLEKACRQIKAWTKTLPEVPTVSINISTMHLRHPDFIRYVARLFNAYPAARGKLTMELDEEILSLDDSEWHREILTDLASLGILLSIDDFGNGYSSLSQLGSYGISEVKIDRRFVATAATDSAHLHLLHGMVSLVRGLGTTVVIQGIETPEMIESLAAVACNSYQGFALGKPMPAEYVSALFNAPHPEVVARMHPRNQSPF